MYRGAGLSPLEFQGLYDLFPRPARKSQVPVSAAWPDEWPHNSRQGVYAILDDALTVLYVGKASMRNVIGSRLSSYFGYDETRGCKIYHKWTNTPRYIAAIAVPQNSTFEAPALEEFLIQVLDPSDNSKGRDKE
jgi:excinuclease UvrABC nuclease subunit